MHHHWDETDFRINNLFWQSKSLELQQAIRFRNLSDVWVKIMSSGLGKLGIHGRTLLNAQDKGSLLWDHDDDLLLQLHPSDIGTRASALFDRLKLRDLGFNCIREGELQVASPSPNGMSIERFGRYVDIHVTFGEASPEGTVSLLDHEFSFFESSQAENLLKYGTPSTTGSALDNLSRAMELFRSYESKREFANVAARQMASSLRKRGLASVHRSKPISQDTFLNLRFDFSDALNWELRKGHYEILFKRGETLGESLERLQLNDPDNKDIAAQLLETPMEYTYLEPIGTNREFWRKGNNFFAAPYLCGFRHGVIPYHEANGYIQTVNSPALFTLEYFRALKPMSDEEIAYSLRSSPLEVRRGAFRSGRHRVATMLGRLVRGEPYIPIWIT